MNGEKNVNVFDIINKGKDIVKPTNYGIPDDFISPEGAQSYERDERERIPLDVIDGDETKPLDNNDIIQRLTVLENIVLGNKRFPEGTIVEATTEEFITSIREFDLPIGATYFDYVNFTDGPFRGNAELILEVARSEVKSDGVLILRLYSSTISPHSWLYVEGSNEWMATGVKII